VVPTVLTRVRGKRYEYGDDAKAKVPWLKREETSTFVEINVRQASGCGTHFSSVFAILKWFVGTSLGRGPAAGPSDKEGGGNLKLEDKIGDVLSKKKQSGAMRDDQTMAAWIRGERFRRVNRLD